MFINHACFSSKINTHGLVHLLPLPHPYCNLFLCIRHSDYTYLFSHSSSSAIIIIINFLSLTIFILFPSFPVYLPFDFPYYYAFLFSLFRIFPSFFTLPYASSLVTSLSSWLFFGKIMIVKIFVC